jgi:hypothetical protein
MVQAVGRPGCHPHNVGFAGMKITRLVEPKEILGGQAVCGRVEVPAYSP